MRYYTRDNSRIDISIGGLQNFSLQGLELSSNDISENVFGRAHAYTLRVTIFTDELDIYTGSLIGQEITLSSPDVALTQKRFIIVSNLGGMSANYYRESVTIEAVDYYISGLQYQKTKLRGYCKLSAILDDVFPELTRYWGSAGWSTVNRLNNMLFNVDALYEDDGLTAPSLYNLLEAVLKYINRNVYVDEVPSVHFYSYNDIASVPTLNIDGLSIAEADRSITMVDAACKYSLNSQYDDIDTTAPEVSYSTKQDYGKITVNKVETYYSAYYGEDGCVIDYPASLPSLDDFSVAAIKAAVEAGESGAVFVSSQSSTDGTYNASGREDRLMMIGIATDQNSHYTYSFGSDVYVLDPGYYTPDSVSIYLQIHHSRRFCEYPVAGASDNKEYKPNKYYLSLRYNITFHFADSGSDYSMERYINVGANNSARDVVITTGTDFSPWANGRIAQNFDNSGTLINIGQISQIRGRQISAVDIRLYPGVYLSNDGTNWEYSTFGCQYCFDDFSAEIAVSAPMDSEVFDTDTVYVWRNDVEEDKQININGEDRSEDATYVTYCGKRSGRNVVLRSYNTYDGVSGNYTDYAGNEADSQNYYGRDCNSEERQVADYGRQYGVCRFLEEITLRGLIGFDRVMRDTYFGKICRVVAVQQDIIEGVTHIKALEYGNI